LALKFEETYNKNCAAAFAAVFTERRDPMIERFQGQHDARRLILALRLQQIICDEEQLATELAEVAELTQIEPSGEFVIQGAHDNDIYFILAGLISLRINGRQVARRKEDQHVGEIPSIDPTKERLASLIAVEQTVVARVTEQLSPRIAEKHPQLWRRLAIELANRLREREKFLKRPNEQPEMFIGSSKEGVSVAREIQSGLSRDEMLVSVWTDGVFGASRTAIESLLEAVDRSDFAILVLTADDTVVSRDCEHNVPRDNCIFELGLFMGALGRERTFIVKPRGVEIRVPSDLLGVTPIEYASGQPETLRVRVAPVAVTTRETYAF
jgi:CRP/FNR family cyclic AMP-dependent transcriptional regulator